MMLGAVSLNDKADKIMVSKEFLEQILTLRVTSEGPGTKHTPDVAIMHADIFQKVKDFHFSFTDLEFQKCHADLGLKCYAGNWMCFVGETSLAKFGKTRGRSPSPPPPLHPSSWKPLSI